MSFVDIKNQILQRLTIADFGAIKPFMSLVQLELRQVLIKPGAPIERVHFMETAVASLTAAINGSEPIEVGLIGYEGVTDHVLIMGDSSALRCCVQLAGTAFAVEAGAYSDWISERPSVLRLMFRYQQAMAIQLSFAALSHGSFTIEERLSRCLLMNFDRNNGEDLAFAHEQLARGLSVRRAGVTSAIHALEGHGAIKGTRGNIHLRDRAVLENLAAGCYGTPEIEYLRLMGPLAAN
ncbi:MAG: cyclic nucleotide-binding protein [Hyphomicrobiales bacterium]|nr:cyclic nucleotide-binding protein [Hyphomicrobiales bacterium]